MLSIWTLVKLLMRFCSVGRRHLRLDGLRTGSKIGWVIAAEISAEWYLCDWKSVARNVLQGLMLEPCLFVTHIKYLDEHAEGIISEFTDNTKIGSVIDNKGLLKLQRDIDQLGKLCRTAADRS